MKSEKNTLKKFGGLIHKYTIQDGVADGAIVPLIYEGRFVEQKLTKEHRPMVSANNKTSDGITEG